MSKVIVVRYPGPVKLHDEIKFSSSIYNRFVTKALLEQTGKAEINAALQKYLPRGRIGLKTNCLTGKLNSTSTALVEAVSDILTHEWFSINDIIVWDRTNRELERAGFKLNASSQGLQCFGTDAGGVGYDRGFHSYGRVNSLITRILTRTVDANINLPILKDHSIAGLSGCLKNMYGAIHNPNKYHGDNCDPYASDVSNLKPIKEKNRLAVIDAVRVQYNAGPGYDSRYIAAYNGIILSDDPVAADTVGLRIIEHYRKLRNLPSLKDAGRPADYLKTAERSGLGIANLDNIDLWVFVDRIDLNAEGMFEEGDLFDG